MKKILLISQVFPPDPAAVGQHFFDLARSLVERGCSVTVLSADRGYDDPGLHFPRREFFGGVTVVRLPFASFGKGSMALRLLGGGFVFLAGFV